MKIDKVLSFLTYPGKHADEQFEIGGTVIPHNGKLFSMLSNIFENAEKDCDIPIIFLSEDDAQKNAVRDEIVELSKSKALENGRTLANRLQLATTGKSGMGLLFLAIANEGSKTKIVISRFPADEGIVAERKSKTLKVEFVEEVFLKSAHSYKSAMYTFDTFGDSLWKGFAVDKQINSGAKEVSAYWINDFLKSDFQTTPRAGTRRLAKALRHAIESSDDISVKSELTSSAKLAKNISSKAMTIADFCDQFHLSDQAKKEVCEQVSPSRLLEDKFVFDASEFEKTLSYKMVELNNGAMLSAQTSNFDNCFEVEKLSGEKDELRYSTTGKVVDEKLRRRK